MCHSFARNAYAPLEGRVKETETQEVDVAFAIWSLGDFKIRMNLPFTSFLFFGSVFYPFCDLIDWGHGKMHDLCRGPKICIKCIKA